MTALTDCLALFAVNCLHCAAVVLGTTISAVSIEQQISKMSSDEDTGDVTTDSSASEEVRSFFPIGLTS